MLFGIAQPLWVKIPKIIPNMTKKAGLSGKIVNHNLMKKTCQNLINTGVPSVIICQLTGHKDPKSRKNCTTADINHQKAMSNILMSKSDNVSNKSTPPQNQKCLLSVSSDSTLSIIPKKKEKCH